MLFIFQLANNFMFEFRRFKNRPTIYFLYTYYMYVQLSFFLSSCCLLCVTRDSENNTNFVKNGPIQLVRSAIGHMRGTAGQPIQTIQTYNRDNATHDHSQITARSHVIYSS